MRYRLKGRRYRYLISGLRNLLKRLHLDVSIQDLYMESACACQSVIDRLWVFPRILDKLCPSFMLYLIKVYFHIQYFLWITIPLAILSYLWGSVLYILHDTTKRSLTAKKFMIHLIAMCEIIVNIARVFVTTTFSAIIIDGIQMTIDVTITYIDAQFSGGDYGIKKDRGEEMPSSLTYAELNDLIYYEEISSEEEEKLNGGDSSIINKRKMRKNMHHYVPPQIFRATVKVEADKLVSENEQLEKIKSAGSIASVASVMSTGSFKSIKSLKELKELITHGPTVSAAGETPSLPTSTELKILIPDSLSGKLGDSWNSSKKSNSDNEECLEKSPEKKEEADSPASFPPTPFSREKVMNRSADRVTSTLFAARDILRMEAQSTSRDEYSRKAAVEAKFAKKMAIFDPSETSDGLALTCGNHCLMKVGKGSCYSSRSMIGIERNTFVYFEFSVTISKVTTEPEMIAGFSTNDAPLTSMVGESDCSFGIHSDGRYLIGGKWFQDESLQNKVAGKKTVGILIYIPDDTRGNDDSDNEVSEKISEKGRGKDISGKLSYEEKTKELSDEESGWKTTGLDALSDDFLFHVNINGHILRMDNEAKLALSKVVVRSLRNKCRLYPSVSLMSQNMRVWCRFCEADLLNRNRSAIGAPPGSRVYGLDGSLLNFYS